MPVDTAPELRFGIAKEDLTGLAGLALTAGFVKYLGRMTLGALAGLAECARIVSRRLVPQLVRHCRQSQGGASIVLTGWCTRPDSLGRASGRAFDPDRARTAGSSGRRSCA